MKKAVFWRSALTAAVCLAALAPAWAAEPPVLPESPPALQRELPREELNWLAIPNARAGRLDRYAAWAAQNPEASSDRVVTEVNMDLDQPFYQNIQTVEDLESLTVLVNKHHALPAGYVPELEALGAPYGSGSLRPEAAAAFRAMADAARADGITLRSVSAYRSYWHQFNTYNRYLTYNRQAVVDTFSARPGHSEHQTGLALDINVASMKARFENTPAYAWLQEHCAQYGFLLRYAQGKEAITGYSFEPWHYRYVGEEIAKICMEQGLTYEEYLAAQPEPLPEPEEPSAPGAETAPAETSGPVLPPLWSGTPIEV